LDLIIENKKKIEKIKKISIIHFMLEPAFSIFNTFCLFLESDKND